MSLFGLSDISRITNAQTRSICAENPDGAKGGSCKAVPPDASGKNGTDANCSAAASALGKGWKVRPCILNLQPGSTHVLADVKGPGVIQHIWITVLESVHRWMTLKIYYDNQAHPSVEVPLGDFFANGIDGLALVNSMPIAVNPKGGMNCYWPMPFRRSIRIEMSNDGPKTVEHFFFQITYALQDVPEDAGYFHASWRRSLTTRENPEHTIIDNVKGKGQYVGTYLVWSQLSNDWWGEGEVKFFIDGDPADSPTICGTGTEDYFGGAWGFVMDHAKDLSPVPYTTNFLGYPQACYAPVATTALKARPRVPQHGLYRWHIPDPVRFQQDLRVTVQALGWWPNGKYQPLTDDIASTAYWYQTLPGVKLTALPAVEERFQR